MTGRTANRERYSPWVQLETKKFVPVGAGGPRSSEVTMRIALTIILAAVVLIVSALALMNNACKSSQHEWCAPMATVRHHVNTEHG